MEEYKGVKLETHSFLTLVLEEDEWPNVGSCIPEKEPLVPRNSWLGGPYNRSVNYTDSYTSRYRLVYCVSLHL